MTNGTWNGPNAFRALWNASPDAMVLTDAAGVVLAANPAYCALHGFSPKGLGGKSLAVIFPEADRPAAMAHYRLVFESRNNPSTYPAATQWRDEAGRLIESRITFITRVSQEPLMLSSVRVVPESPMENLAIEPVDEGNQRFGAPGTSVPLLASGPLGPGKTTPDLLAEAIQQWGIEMVLGLAQPR